MKSTAKLFSALTASLLLVATSQAEVLIYKGSIHAKTDAKNALPPVSGVFLLLDPLTSEVASVATLRIDGQKVIAVTPPGEIRIATTDLTKGRTATTLSSGITQGSTNEFFSNSIIYFRGTNSTLKLATTSIGSSLNFPRVFTGSGLSASQSKFLEQKLVVSFQQTRTIQANDAAQTIDQALEVIVAELKAQGFVTP